MPGDEIRYRQINIGTEIRQAYEVVLKVSGDVAHAQQAVYERTRWVLNDLLQVSGIRAKVTVP